MIRLGEIQELEVVKKVDFGVYLKSPDSNLESENGKEKEEKVLLPIKQVPKDVKIGDKIEVFIYRDSSDRIISTINRPKIVMGEIGFLRVAEISRIGAFLKWGLEKDLFLPFKEQIGDIRLNGEYMVGLYIDKSNRLCATMNLFKVLRTDSPYKVNDLVKGTVFSLKRGLGASVAVDGKYLGLIHEGEILKPLKAGDEVELRISNIKEDGKLDLSLKDSPKLQINMDADKIFSLLAKNKGFIPINDNTSPEVIKEKLGMSKASFKKAVGRLLKKGLIEITRDGIKIANKENKIDKKGNIKNNFNNKNKKTFKKSTYRDSEKKKYSK